MIMCGAKGAVAGGTTRETEEDKIAGLLVVPKYFAESVCGPGASTSFVCATPLLFTCARAREAEGDAVSIKITVPPLTAAPRRLSVALRVSTVPVADGAAGVTPKEMVSPPSRTPMPDCVAGVMPLEVAVTLCMP